MSNTAPERPARSQMRPVSKKRNYVSANGAHDSEAHEDTYSSDFQHYLRQSASSSAESVLSRKCSNDSMKTIVPARRATAPSSTLLASPQHSSATTIDTRSSHLASTAFSTKNRSSRGHPSSNITPNQLARMAEDLAITSASGSVVYSTAKSSLPLSLAQMNKQRPERNQISQKLFEAREEVPQIPHSLSHETFTALLSKENYALNIEMHLPQDQMWDAPADYLAHYSGTLHLTDLSLSPDSKTALFDQPPILLAELEFHMCDAVKPDMTTPARHVKSSYYVEYEGGTMYSGGKSEFAKCTPKTGIHTLPEWRWAPATRKNGKKAGSYELLFVVPLPVAVFGRREYCKFRVDASITFGFKADDPYCAFLKTPFELKAESTIFTIESLSTVRHVGAKLSTHRGATSTRRGL